MPQALTAKEKQLDALKRSRAGTQFQPLDSDSPTVRILIRMPLSLVDQLDAARADTPRSEWIRTAVTAALQEPR